MLALPQQVLVTAKVTLEGEEIALRALDAYWEGTTDFSDHLLALGNHAAGYGTTLSFNTRLCAHPLPRTDWASSSATPAARPPQDVQLLVERLLRQLDAVHDDPDMNPTEDEEGPRCPRRRIRVSSPQGLTDL